MPDPDAKSVPDTAAEWFVRLRDEMASAADRQAFRDWLAADPAHRAAYRDLERLWSGLDQVDPHAIDRAVGAPVPPRPPPDPARLRPAGRIPSQRRLTRRAALAASVAALVAGGYAASRPDILSDYGTRAGERKTIALDDGTRIELNTASALSLDYGPFRRQVTLHRGEAYFQVASEPDRPFAVEAGPGRAVVLGTGFAMRRRDAETEVVLAEGRVAVSAPSAPAAGTVELKPGEGVVVTRTGPGPVRMLDTDRALAWRTGRLVFDATPLSEVLAEIGRYRFGDIRVMDDTLDSLPVTGAFSITSSDQALRTLERTLPVRLVRMTDLLVLVYPDKNGQT